MDISEMPSEIQELMQDLSNIRKLLNQFEQTGNSILFQEAATSIKKNAPKIKLLASQDEYKMGSGKDALDQAKEEMRSSFARARQLKADIEEKRAAEKAKREQEEKDKQEKEEQVKKREEEQRVEQEKAKKVEEEKKKAQLPPEDLEKVREAEEREKVEKAEQEAKRKSESDEKERQEQEERERAREKDREERRKQEQSMLEAIRGGSRMSPSPSTKVPPDIWTKALEERDSRGLKNDGEPTTGDQNTSLPFYVGFVGMQGAGKTTFLRKYLEKSRQQTPEPTMGLEYIYGRRPKKWSTNEAKDIVHAWELGGGLKKGKVNTNVAYQLLQAVITPENIHALTLSIFVDLSKPGPLFDQLQSWLDVLRSSIDEILKSLRTTSQVTYKNKQPTKQALSAQATLDAVHERSAALIPQDHPDKDTIRPVGIPVLIVGTKFDEFAETTEPQLRKIACKSLRYVAHSNGCGLAFLSMKQDTLIGKVRGMLNNHLFGSKLAKLVVTDHSNPLFIPSGQDSFTQIGTPTASSSSVGGSSGGGFGLRSWREEWTHFFPLDPRDAAMEQDEEFSAFSVDDKIKYSEPLIDSVRHEKDQELERYMKEHAIKMRSLGYRREGGIGGGEGSAPSSQFERAMARRQQMSSYG